METIFEKIDLYLNGKKPNEARLLILIFAVLIAFLTYTYSFDSSTNFLKKTSNEHKQTLAKYKEEKNYEQSIAINGDRNYYVTKFNNEIEQAKIDLEKTINTNSYVDNKLKDLSYLLFNDKNWSLFLDNLAFLAKENRINLKKISNEFKEPSLQKIEQVLTIELDFSGRFIDILKFINTIEENRLVVDIYEVEIVSSDKLDGSMKIAVWGMKY
ncbi:MAG: hypothetical protein M0P02_04490 [Sulfurospirillaceae bacterium]|jgi:biopolymer transport protein ExbD|nr:hypothetical protein [Sulfurospirillaceae bacterium]MCK9546420.1 hypothetical protein [Sulfurospirillaceae bacterium]MDY0237871.1 hypothetical protein [Campylobacterales bacterium]NLM98542.1 hypothetical protein [Campylobacteraceae bacterium]